MTLDQRNFSFPEFTPGDPKCMRCLWCVLVHVLCRVGSLAANQGSLAGWAQRQGEKR